MSVFYFKNLCVMQMEIGDCKAIADRCFAAISKGKSEIDVCTQNPAVNMLITRKSCGKHD